MKFRMIIASFALLFLVAGISAQGISGSFKLTGVHVQYYEVARDSGAAAEDVGSVHDVVLSWPNALAPAFQFPVSHYDVGDTIAAPDTPDTLLVPQGLAAYGIDLTLTFKNDGTFEIPTSTYPTTNTENCSTYASVPTIQDAGTYEWDGNDNRGQFGIDESDIFDLFDADSTALNRGWLTVFRNPNDQISRLRLEWEAIDGPDSDIGVDDAGILNRQLGLAMLPADTGFVSYLKTLNPSLNVGTYPTVGENFPGDGDDFSANWMYVFDPAGPDGLPFTGDEPLQFTGYYFTYNDMAAIGTLTGLFAAQYASTGSVPTSVTFAVDSTLKFFGCPGSIATAISQVIDDSVTTWLTKGITLEDALKSGVFTSIGAAMTVAAGTWTFPNDSGHDYAGDPTQGGRLVFEMGNQCVPDKQTRIVITLMENVDPTINVEEEEDGFPTKFALRQNYPNPFNPTTTIAFDIPKRSHVAITVWNLLGEKVRTLHSGHTEQGRYTIQFNGRDDWGTPLATGIYLYRMMSEDYTATKKMLLMK